MLAQTAPGSVLVPDVARVVDLDVFAFLRDTPGARALAAGLAPLRIHDLRHTTASLAIAAGADVKVVQTMLGRASAAMTPDRDGRRIPGRGQDVVDRLDLLARTRAAVPEPSASVTRFR